MDMRGEPKFHLLFPLLSSGGKESEKKKNRLFANGGKSIIKLKISLVNLAKEKNQLKNFKREITFVCCKKTHAFLGGEIELVMANEQAVKKHCGAV
jgi:hypothetical protein